MKRFPNLQYRRELLAAAVVCLLCVVAIGLNRPAASTPGQSLVLAWILSATPFVALLGLAVATYWTFADVADQIGADGVQLGRLESHPAAARALVEGWWQTPADAEEGAPRPRRVTFASGLPSGAYDGLVTQSLDGMLRRRVAGEEFTVASLREDLSRVAADLTHRLYTYHLAAFVVGMGGTVLGLVLQLEIARGIAGGGIISQDFLNGILLKASCTLVGLCGGWYAWALRESLLKDIDRLAGRVESFVCLELGPALARPTDGSDPARLVELLVQHMRPVFTAMAEDIRTSFMVTVDEASVRLRSFVASDLARLIDSSLINPFAEEVRGIVARLEAIEGRVREASTGIRAVSDALTTNVGGIGLALEHLMQQITAAGAVLRVAAGDLEATHGGFTSIIEDLRVVRGEMFETVEMLRKVPAPALQKDVVADLIRLAEIVYETLDHVTVSKPRGIAR